MTAARLRVDWTACRAHGSCVELVPELIEADPWGYPVVADADVPSEVRRHAGRAVRQCPRLALSLHTS